MQMSLPVAAPPVKDAFGALRRVRQTQNYKEPFRGIWSERSRDHFKSSRSQGTDCKAFTDLQPLNSCWTIAESYGIILSAIAGIVHRLVYQPSKLRRWVRFPLPAPCRRDAGSFRTSVFLYILAPLLASLRILKSKKKRAGRLPSSSFPARFFLDPRYGKRGKLRFCDGNRRSFYSTLII